ncbi:MAG: S1C family serine protease, partial [bacterium]
AMWARPLEVVPMWGRRVSISAVALLLFLGAQSLARDARDDIASSRVNAIVRAAERVGPAVVSISVIQTRVYASQPFSEFFMDPLIREYFGDFFAPRIYKERIRSLGSGVIVRPEGYVLTNEHVIRGAEEIKVTLPDGRVIAGALVDASPSLDLAVVKIEGRDLPVAPLGESNNLIIGEWAIAIGNPFGYLLDDTQPTVTVGVISALNRAIRTGERSVALYRDMIQTDAAINPGNSGGPLVNADGEVIGINTFIFTSSGGSEGIGFARPISHGKRILDDIVRYGRIRRPWIGARVQSMSEEISHALGLRSTSGVIVVEVEGGGPAEAAGIRRGDVIRRAKSRTIRDQVDWGTFLLSIHVDEKVELEIVRRGKNLKKALVVKESLQKGK